MAEFILLMHDDIETPEDDARWRPYLESLAAEGVLRGGSAIGAGTTLRRTGEPLRTTDHIVGYVKIEADDLGHARTFVAGNPVYEAGGTIEIRALPRSG